MPEGRSNPKGPPPASELTQGLIDRLRELSPRAWVAIGAVIVAVALFVKGPDEGPPRLQPAPPATFTPTIGTAAQPTFGTASVPGIGTASVPGAGGAVTPTSLGAATPPGSTALSATAASGAQPGNVRAP